MPNMTEKREPTSTLMTEHSPFTESRPVPDPTALTNQLVTAAIATLREWVEARLVPLEGLIQNNSERIVAVPDRIRLEVNHLQELHDKMFQVHDQKFNSVDQRFQERDTRTDQAAATTSKAVDAALSAQKEAVKEQNIANTTAIQKSETTTAKALDAISDQLRAVTKGSDDKIADLKDRMTAMENRAAPTAQVEELSRRLTTVEARREGGQSVGVLIFSLIGAAAGLAGIVGLILVMTRGP